jgi:hypothetical protein
VDQVPWEDRFEQLKAHKALKGNCNMPQGCKQNQKLGKWVHDQRTAKKNGKLLEERKTLLEGIGFQWDMQVPWEDRFEQLKACKALKGDCNVPQGHTENPQLGIWVRDQHTAKKKGKLLRGRVQLLERIGFQWIVGKGQRTGLQESPRPTKRRCMASAGRQQRGGQST